MSIIQPPVPSRRGWFFRESSQTPVFEEAEIVTFLDSISLGSLKDIRDKAIFSVLFYSWCRVSALINLTVADYYERGGARWLRFQEKRGKEHEVPVHSKAKEAVDLWLERSYLASNPSTPLFPSFGKNRETIGSTQESAKHRRSGSAHLKPQPWEPLLRLEPRARRFPLL